MSSSEGIGSGPKFLCARLPTGINGAWEEGGADGAGMGVVDLSEGINEAAVDEDEVPGTLEEFEGVAFSWEEGNSDGECSLNPGRQKRWTRTYR